MIDDVSAATFSHLKIFSPTVVKNALTVTQEAYPSNPDAIYFFGLPTFVKSVFNLFKSFLTEKYRNKLQIVGKKDFYKLHEDLGIEILPVEYGGTNKTMQDHLGKSLGITPLALEKSSIDPGPQYYLESFLLNIFSSLSFEEMVKNDNNDI